MFQLVQTTLDGAPPLPLELALNTSFLLLSTVNFVVDTMADTEYLTDPVATLIFGRRARRLRTVRPAPSHRRRVQAV